MSKTVEQRRTRIEAYNESASAQAWHIAVNDISCSSQRRTRDDSHSTVRKAIYNESAVEIVAAVRSLI
jgi:hypothetical protein